jgi:hypothetical protein
MARRGLEGAIVGGLDGWCWRCLWWSLCRVMNRGAIIRSERVKWITNLIVAVGGRDVDAVVMMTSKSCP